MALLIEDLNPNWADCPWRKEIMRFLLVESWINPKKRRPCVGGLPPPPLRVENLQFDLRDPVVVVLKFPYVGDRLPDYSLDVTFQAPYAESRL